MTRADAFGVFFSRALKIMATLCRRAGLLVMLLGFSVGLAQAQSPVGEWRTIDDDTGDAVSIVEIYEENGKLYGKVKEILVPNDDAPTNEDGQIICEACDGERANQPIEGMVIMEGLEQDGDRWTGGRILDPQSGREYRVRLEFEDENLKVRGYVGIAAFGRTQVWHPADG